MHIERYVERLTLDASTAAGPAPGPFRTMEEPGGTALGPAPLEGMIPEKLRAAVNAGSVLSFTADVEVQQRGDVLFSTQLAQRAADGSFDRFAEVHGWYQKYLEVLENLGWVTEQFGFAVYDLKEAEGGMDAAALKIIAGIATQNQLTVVTQALQTLRKLQDDAEPLKLFESRSSSDASGNFQLGAVQRSSDGALSFAGGAFHFRSVDERRRFLFTTWGDREVNFWTAAQKMTLNTKLYAGLREPVRRKLGESASDFIAELTLD